MAIAFERRLRLPFVRWLFETWCDLGGAAVAAGSYQPGELDSVLALFETAIDYEDVVDLADLERFFRRPVREPDAATGSIDIMTIHRAKGLEFDCVILPGLARKPRSPQTRLLEWLEILDEQGERRRVVAPMRKADSAAAQWIRERAREQELAETARLMYVATTRARRRLHLVWGITQAKPHPSSLLAPLWSRLEGTTVEPVEATAATQSNFVLPLRRLVGSLPMGQVRSPDADEQQRSGEADYPWVSSTAAHVGTVVHDWLQSICESDPAQWNEARVESSESGIRTHLELLGVPARDLERCTETVKRALVGVLRDPTGRWIIGDRPEAMSELMLSSIDGNNVVHQRLDRTFVEAGCRWIIDYKTSSCDDGNVEAFLAAEIERYRSQLESYAAAMARQESRPIRLGLYFPMLPAFHDWPAPQRR